MAIIDRRIEEYDLKIKDAIAIKPKERNKQGYTKKKWDEYIAWLQGVKFGLNIAKNI